MLADQKRTMRQLYTRVRLRLGEQSGFSLTELLVTILVLGLVLGATIDILNGARKTSERDRARIETLGRSDVGLARMSTDLRKACAIMPSAPTGTASYCETSLTSAQATSGCAAVTATCIEFIARQRNAITRIAGGSCTSPPCVTRTTLRIRYDCGVADPAANSTTECVRYQSPTLDASPSSSNGVVVARSLGNSGGSPVNVFTYCSKSDSYATSGACSAAPTSAAVVRIALYVMRKGQRQQGLKNGALLQDAAYLRNIALENSA